MRLPSRASRWLAAAAGLAALAARADLNPGPSQPANAVNPPYAAATINAPFPDAVYGADHGGSSLTLSYPFTSPFGYTDHSRGVVTFQCAPFSPRSSEGVYGMDVWLEQQDASGNWSAATLDGGLPDGRSSAFQPINTPNPGPSPGYVFTWTFNQTPLPPNANLRVFVYVYLYNQGGGSQGNFYAASTLGTIATGPANDAPRIQWTDSFGAVNPAQAQAGQSYVISADAQDDNGNLVAVSINKNGQPFAYANGGTGYAGNSQNPASDPVGTAVYTAWAGDSLGAQSPLIQWTVTIAKANQAAVSSNNATLTYYTQPFSPAYLGGSGAGPWEFVIGGYTNWAGGSWMPPAPGSYTFWVERDGDGSFNPSVPSPPYVLSVIPAAPVGSFDGLNSATVTQGQAVAGSGWTADAQLGAPISRVQIQIDQGGGGTSNANLGGSRPDVQAANASYGHWSPQDLTASGWSFSLSTAGLAPGPHTLGAVASDNPYGVATSLGSKSFTVTAPAPTPVSFSASPVIFTYSGAPQGPMLASNPAAAVAGGNYVVTGVSSGVNAGAYFFSVIATGGFTGVGSFSWIIGPATQAPIALTPAAASTTPGGTLVFTASGGSGTGAFSWSGAAAGSGVQATVIFPSAGTYGVTVTKAGDANFLPSAPANAEVSVTAPIPPPPPPAPPPAPPPPPPPPPAPPPPGDIARIRFNPTGNDAVISPRQPAVGASILWTDPAQLPNSPWPTFANPAPAAPALGNFPLPAVP